MRLCRIAVALLFTACTTSSEGTPPPDGGGLDASVDETGADGGGSDASDAAPDAGGAPQFCTAETPSIGDGGAGIFATTTHYDLYAETTVADATDMARLLEASSGAWASWFERTAPSQRSKVKFYKDQPSWVAGLAADGIVAPAEAGGYYDPGTKTAYLFKQGNPYYTHVLLVHEATHQFHFLTRLQGQSLPFWYVEGHAEYLSRHDWDGQCVRLGVMSLLSWEDLPAKAEGEGNIDVAGIVGGSVTGSRADAWAIFRYLDTGALRPAFKAYRDAMDANTSPSFATLVAAPASLSAPITAWVPTAQEPMTPIFTEWIHVGPTAVNVDTPVYFSLAVVKQATTHFEAKFQVPSSGNFTTGVVISYTDNKNYQAVVHSNDGKVRTFTAAGTAIWADIGTAPAPTAMLEAIAVDFTSGNASVTFNGAPFSLPTSTPRAGLAASDTTGHFIDVSWK